VEEASFVRGDNEALAAFGATALEEDDAEARHAVEGWGEAAFGLETEGGEEVGDEVGFTGVFAGEECGKDAVMGWGELCERGAWHVS
jgi:hypothetical protein